MKFIATVATFALALFGAFHLGRTLLKRIGPLLLQSSPRNRVGNIYLDSHDENDRDLRVLLLIFRLAGWLCKCDGPIVKEEIASLEQFLDSRPNISSQVRRLAIEEFRNGKAASGNYEKIRSDAFDLYWLHRGRRKGLSEIYRLLMSVAMSDGALNASEEVVLEMISQSFGLGLKEATLIRNSVVREFWNEHKQYYQKASEERKKTEQRLADQARAWVRSSDYTALGLKPNATREEIKKAYRKLVKQFHPDMLRGKKSMSEAEVKEASKRFQEIQTAYDRLLTLKNSSKAA